MTLSKAGITGLLANFYNGDATKWTQGVNFRDKHGFPGVDQTRAASFCFLGALRVMGIVDSLGEYYRDTLMTINDKASYLDPWMTLQCAPQSFECAMWQLQEWSVQ